MVGLPNELCHAINQQSGQAPFGFFQLRPKKCPRPFLAKVQHPLRPSESSGDAYSPASRSHNSFSQNQPFLSIKPLADMSGLWNLTLNSNTTASSQIWRALKSPPSSGDSSTWARFRPSDPEFCPTPNFLGCSVQREAEGSVPASKQAFLWTLTRIGVGGQSGPQTHQVTVSCWGGDGRLGLGENLRNPRWRCQESRSEEVTGDTLRHP